MTFEILQVRPFPVHNGLEIRNMHSHSFHTPQYITRISTENFVPVVMFALYWSISVSSLDLNTDILVGSFLAFIPFFQKNAWSIKTPLSLVRFIAYSMYLIKYSGLQYRYNYINIEMNLPLFPCSRHQRKGKNNIDVQREKGRYFETEIARTSAPSLVYRCFQL